MMRKRETLTGANRRNGEIKFSDPSSLFSQFAPVQLWL